MKHQYNLYVPRNYAVLYLSWELGIQRVYAALDRLSTDSRGWHNFADFTIMRGGKKRWTKRGLASLAAHIREVVSFQEGRLGRKLSGGGGLINVHQA